MPALLTLRTADSCSFFSMARAGLGFVLAARSNPTLPGYVEIIRK